MEALILPPVSRAVRNVVLGGLSVAERAALALHQGGVNRVLVPRTCGIDDASVARLARHGIVVTRAGEAPLASIAPGGGALIVSADVVFEPSAVGALLEHIRARGWSGGAAADPTPGTFVALTPSAVDALRAAPETRVLEALGALRVVALGAVFCRVLSGAKGAKALQRDYLAHRHGPAGLIVRVIRSFSMLATALFLRLQPGRTLLAHPLTR